MIYKVFASIFENVEKIEAFRFHAKALNFKYYTEFRKIEANSKSEAYEKFNNQYDSLIDTLNSKHAYFYCVDNNGNITQ